MHVFFSPDRFFVFFCVFARDNFASASGGKDRPQRGQGLVGHPDQYLEEVEGDELQVPSHRQGTVFNVMLQWFLNSVGKRG